MIPKIIHYFWFGGQPLNEMAKKCIESWKKYCPDYEIIEWNENNYDITKNQYMFQSYNAKKYGFTVDYARLDIIYNYGGIYLDADVELIQSLDGMLHNQCFMGFETDKTVALGLGFGAEAGNEIIYSLLHAYDNLVFVLPDGKLNLRPSPGIQTDVMIHLGMIPNGKKQIIAGGCCVYPKEVLNPCDLDTNRILIEKNTVSIHHYAGSWLTKSNQRNKKVYSLVARCVGVDFAKWLRRVKRKFSNK